MISKADCGAEPRTAAALPRMITIEIRCQSQAVSRLSPDVADNKRPSSLRNLVDAGPNTPDVSTPIGENRYCDEMLRYPYHTYHTYHRDLHLSCTIEQTDVQTFVTHVAISVPLWRSRGCERSDNFAFPWCLPFNPRSLREHFILQS